jgi:hypothetical protein
MIRKVEVNRPGKVGNRTIIAGEEIQRVSAS